MRRLKSDRVSDRKKWAGKKFPPHKQSLLKGGGFTNSINHAPQHWFAVGCHIIETQSLNKTI
jgi:hypothetical protein